jgi:signal transduction histidine kinase
VRPPGWVRRGGDVCLVLLVAGIDLIAWSGDREMRDGTLLAAWVVPAVTALLCAALLVRRRYPVPVFALMWLHALAPLLVPRYQPLACLLAGLYAVAARTGVRTSGPALAACAVPIGVDGYYVAVTGHGGTSVWRFLAYAALLCAVVGVVWGLGRWSHLSERRARQAREELAEQAHRALLAERLRLARELHDSVTGAVSAMILHAAGARGLLGQDEQRVRDALTVVEECGATAMRELHNLLGLLRASAAERRPEPGLADLHVPVELARLGGMRVDLRVSGPAGTLPGDADLTGYRLVQEALTNAGKHAGPDASVRVELDWRPGGVRLSVHSSGRSAPSALSSGAPAGLSSGHGPAGLSSGHGLAGLAERVELVGGTLSSGPVPDGFLVRAWLPGSPGTPGVPAPEGEGEALLS